MQKISSMRAMGRGNFQREAAHHWTGLSAELRTVLESILAAPVRVADYRGEIKSSTGLDCEPKQSSAASPMGGGAWPVCIIRLSVSCPGWNKEPERTPDKLRPPM